MEHSSDDPMRVTHGEGGTHTKHKRSDYRVILGEESMLKLLIRSNVTGSESDKRDNSMLTSEGSTPNLLVRGESKDEKSCKKTNGKA